MIYIIDANNLAGAVGLLGHENFNRKLIGLIRNYLAGRKIRTFLVFDGYDFMGDRESASCLSVIYVPKDNYYKSADDKIVELVLCLRATDKDEMAVITDDRGLIDAIKIKTGDDRKIKFISAEEFAGKLKPRKHKEKMSPFSINTADDSKSDKDIGENNIRKINDELLKIWTNEK